MGLRKLSAWILTAAFLAQAVPPGMVLAEPVPEETISVGSGTAVETEEIAQDEISAGGNDLVSGLSLHIGNDTLATPPDGTEDEPERRNGHIDSGFEFRNPEGLELLTGGELPGKYISPYVTPVRNQSKYGTCWAFAGTGAIEASMVKHNGADKNTLDLSDLATAYFGIGDSYDNENRFGNDSMTFLQDNSEYEALLEEARQSNPDRNVLGQVVDSSLGYANSGGNSFYTMYGLAHWNGLIPESEAPYPLEDKYEDHTRLKELTESLRNDPGDDKRVVRLEEGLMFQMSDPALVKNMLLEYGAVDASYYSLNDYYSEDKSSFYQNEYEKTNHEVLLVGWDDDYPRGNFNAKCRPRSDGAWIVKNSWGTNWGTAIEDGGERGYFYISYEDAGLLSSDANCYLVGDVDSYDHNYQYDGTGIPVWYAAECSDGTYMANVYKVDNAGSDEKLKAVGIFTGPDVDYQVEIYKNPDMADGVAENPRTGKLIGTAAGKEAFMGYHTVPVSCDDVLTAGDWFSVVVYQKTDKGKVYVFVDVDRTKKPVTAETWTTGVSNTRTMSYYGKFHSDSDSSAGQSFTTIIHRDNNNWVDLTEHTPDGCNVRLKAFTSDVCTLGVSQNSVRLFPGQKYSQEVTVVRGKKLDGAFTYTSSDEKVAVVDDAGVVTAAEEGTAEIMVEAPDGAVLRYEVVVKLTDVSEVSFGKIPAQVLTEGAAMPKVEASYEDVPLEEGKDYTVSYKNNTKPASARGIERDPQAVVAMQGYFKGEKSLHFSIEDRSSGSTDLSRASVSGLVPAVYTGRGIFQQPQVRLQRTLLTEGKDYYLTYENNVNAGKAVITVHGCGAYTGTIVKNFTIKSAAVTSPEFTVKLSDYALAYQPGEEARPEVFFTDGRGRDVPKSDYTVVYKDNGRAGIAKAVVKAAGKNSGGSGNLKGSRTIYFVVVDADHLLELEDPGRTYTYTGAAIKPDITSFCGTDGTVYAVGRGWKVKYYDNKNAGEALVLLAGKGANKGKAGVCHFTIEKQKAPNLTVSAIKPQKFRGKALCPKPKIKNGKKTLKAGTDYVAYYYDNTGTGTGSVTLQFCGNYEGEKEISFSIK